MAFDAFISYSHGDDSKIAKALQDNLHRLAKRWDSLSAIRVFRDATHLPITALEPAIVSALENSKFLILLASPQSAASKWVHEEIAYFLGTHTPDQVLLVLIDGDLKWNKTSQNFESGPASAFPAVDTLVFEKEPLFLDLRWAATDSDLSLSNPRLLDAVATLAATVQEVPKDTLVGDLVEEHRRLRNNQRINLGFRGAFGFGIAAALFFLLGTAYSITTNAVFSRGVTGYFYFVFGFPTIGVIGALCCGTGWRGIAGFAAGFLGLLPLYVLGSVSPDDVSVADIATLAAMTLAGFIGAGALGALFCPRIHWSDGTKAFGVGGVVAACLMPVFSAQGIQTHLAAWPWLPTRFWLQARSGLTLVANVIDQRQTGVLVPLIVGVTIAGLLLGVRLADARTRTGSDKSPQRGLLPSVLKLRLSRRVAIAVSSFALIYWGASLRNAKQSATASEGLTAEAFQSVLTVSDDIGGRVTLKEALPLALRARNVLDRRGEHEKAEDLSRLISQVLLDFSQNPSYYYERYASPPFEPPTVGDIGQILVDLGRPDELAHFRNGVREQAKETGPLATIAAVRAKGVLGDRDEALATLRRASASVKQQHWFDDIYERTLIAQAFVEFDDVESATKLLKRLTTDITDAANDSNSTFSGLHDQFSPESGDALWRTGIWNELPSWRDELGEVATTIAEGMCRRGETEAATTLVRENRTSTAFWHTHARLAKAAARERHYDTAFAVLDVLDDVDDPGWTTFVNRAEGLTEIARAASIRGDVDMVKKASAELSIVERRVRERSELDRASGVALANGYAQAGEFEAAGKVARDVTDERWAADLSIGVAMSAAGRDKAAYPMLAQAWRGLQAGLTDSSSNPSGTLSLIGGALAKIGKLQAAKAVADDTGSLDRLSIYVEILEYGQTP